MSFFVIFLIKIVISKTNNIMLCTFLVFNLFLSWCYSQWLEVWSVKTYLDQNLKSRTSSAESGVVTVAELTFNSAELRNTEVVGWVFGYSQSPISSFPISLFMLSWQLDHPTWMRVKWFGRNCKTSIYFALVHQYENNDLGFKPKKVKFEHFLMTIQYFLGS